MSFRFLLLNKKTFLSSLVIVISLAVSFATCYFANPTVFGGRDQGSISTAAINLAKYKSFSFSTQASKNLFQKYGPGKALNYPGFDYKKNGQLSSRFPKMYIVYSAGLYSLFGLKGIQFANFVPLFIFFILFWLTLRHFFDDKISFFGFLLAATFFPFIWFSKYTLTEIFTLFLVWGGIFFLIRLFKKPSALNVYSSLAFFGLSALSRIEGIIFFILATVYVFILDKKSVSPLKPRQKKFVFVASLILLALFIALNFPTLLDSAKNIAKAYLPSSTKDSTPSTNLYARLFVLFFNYGLLPYLVLGVIGIAILLRKIGENFSKPEFSVFFVFFPSFFYFISPLVSLDDPWMFRRFTFSVFPVLIFYSVYFLNRYKKNKIFVFAALSALLALNIFIASQYIGYYENKNLLSQTEALSKKFAGKDLVLVDRETSGSGWSLLSDPLSSLFEKQAVYFFNAEDLQYINLSKYQNVYLLAPLDAKSAWYDNLERELTETVTIKNNYLTPSKGFFSLSRNQNAEVKNGIWRIKK